MGPALEGLPLNSSAGQWHQNQPPYSPGNRPGCLRYNKRSQRRQEDRVAPLTWDVCPHAHDALASSGRGPGTARENIASNATSPPASQNGLACSGRARTDSSSCPMCAAYCCSSDRSFNVCKIPEKFRGNAWRDWRRVLTGHIEPY